MWGAQDSDRENDPDLALNLYAAFLLMHMLLHLLYCQIVLLVLT